jgi:SAM-dependent methyltransferase
MYPMHLLCTQQLETLLGGRRPKRALDVGAGSGDVTVQLRELCTELTTTERSRGMARALRRRGFNCLYTGLADGEVPGAPYDLISLFNVIDRCPRPRSLLDTLHDALTADGQLLLATPLPYQPFYYRGASGRRPLEALPQNAPTWEEGVVRLAEEFLELSGFEVVSVSRCPYLSGGDRHSGLYVLDDAVFLCSKRA